MPKRLFTILTAAFALAGVPYAAASAATSTGQADVNSCLKAALGQATVHTKSVSTSTPGSSANVDVSVTIITDAGQSDGVQTVTYRKSGKSGQQSIEFVGGVAYLKSDAFTLENFNGFSSTVATKYANKWISLKKSQTAYAPVAAGLTIPSIISELKMPAPQLIGEAEDDGFMVNRLDTNLVDGTESESVLLSCRIGKKPLPVEQQESGSGGGSDVTFTKWGESLKVVAPKDAIPYKSA